MHVQTDTSVTFVGIYRCYAQLSLWLDKIFDSELYTSLLILQKGGGKQQSSHSYSLAVQNAAADVHFNC